MKKPIIFILFFSFLQQVLNAQSDIDSLKNDLLHISDEEMLNKVVTAPTKIEEKINESSASVSIYTSKDIRQLGYYTLSELTNITTGYGSTLQYAEKGLETRGFATDAYNNNKHLMLIDGIPISLGRSNKVFTQEEIPLFFAKRVELMKGPASALYGTGAFYGVINVHRNSLKKFGSEINAYSTYSAALRQKRTMINAIKRGKFGEAWFSGGYYAKDPTETFLGSSQNADFRYWDGNKSIFTYVGFAPEAKWLDGFTFGLISLSRQGQLGEMWLGNETSALNKITWEAFNPYIKYEKQISEKSKLVSYLKYNVSSEEAYHNTDKSINNGAVRVFNAYKSVVRNAELSTEWQYASTTNRHIIVGVNYDLRYELGTPESWNYYINVPSDSIRNFSYPKDTMNFYNPSAYFQTYSFYTQVHQHVDFLKGLTITAGLREDIGMTGYYTFARLSPRIVTMQRITNNWNFKMMYGRALRSPTLKEVGLNRQFTDELNSKSIYPTNLNSLKAEWIESLEISSNITFNKFLLNVSVFRNNNHGTITSTSLPFISLNNDTVNGNWFLNQQNVWLTSGVEFELKYDINQQFQFWGNTTLIKKGQMQNLVNKSHTKVIAGILWSSKKWEGASFALVSRYLTNFSNNNYLSKQILFFDANLRIPIVETLIFELQAKNLLNKKYYWNVQNVSVPLDQRFISLGLSFSM